MVKQLIALSIYSFGDDPLDWHASVMPVRNCRSHTRLRKLAIKSQQKRAGTFYTTLLGGLPLGPRFGLRGFEGISVRSADSPDEVMRYTQPNILS